MAGSPPKLPPLSDGDFDLSDGLLDGSDNAELCSVISGEIQAKGPITFRHFMELALYHPTLGYYSSTRERIGRSGDYVTSPELSPLFGYAIARQLGELWRCLESPKNFSILECGAGNGRLARDVLRWMAERDPACYEAVIYTLQEISAPQRAIQAETLATLMRSGKVRVELKPDLHLNHGCLIANELLDSFPVHRVTTGAGGLQELYVGLDGNAFVEMIGPPSTPRLAGYFSRLGLLPGEGCVAEVNLDVQQWLTETAGWLRSGYCLLLDYGYPAERLYAPWRRDGTLLCYHRHEAGSDPYRFIGRQDITSHVDFTSLVASALDAGLDLAGFTDQARFLQSLGIANGVRRRPEDERDMQEFYGRRRAVEALTDPAGLGRIGVLLLAKKAPACDFIAFREQIAQPRLPGSS